MKIYIVFLNNEYRALTSVTSPGQRFSSPHRTLAENWARDMGATEIVRVGYPRADRATADLWGRVMVMRSAFRDASSALNLIMSQPDTDEDASDAALVLEAVSLFGAECSSLAAAFRELES
jgi:hypothetical protein